MGPDNVRPPRARAFKRVLRPPGNHKKRTKGTWVTRSGGDTHNNSEKEVRSTRTSVGLDVNWKKSTRRREEKKGGQTSADGVMGRNLPARVRGKFSSGTEGTRT